MMEKISVIIPIYKVEAYLDKCIKSLMDQTYRNLEIILVDDGSPDGCPQICDQWAQKDARIRVIHKKNGGLSDARNAGLDAATGAYISFVDADDYVAPTYCEKLYDALKRHNADISAANYRKIDEQGGTLPRNADENLVCGAYTGREVVYGQYRQGFPATVFVIACAKLYKRSVFETYRFALGRLNEDEFAFFPVYLHAGCVVSIEEELYYYLQRQGSIMGTRISEKRIRDNVEYWQQRLALSAEDPLLYKKVAAAYCVWLFLTAFPHMPGKSKEKNELVRQYRHYAGRYIFCTEVDLPLVHKLIYFAAILEPVGVSLLKKKLAGG